MSDDDCVEFYKTYIACDILFERLKEVKDKEEEYIKTLFCYLKAERSFIETVKKYKANLKGTAKIILDKYKVNTLDEALEQLVKEENQALFVLDYDNKRKNGNE